MVTKKELESMLRRSRRHLLSLGESDADMGYKDESLVRLMVDWKKLGLEGGDAMGEMAKQIREKENWMEKSKWTGVGSRRRSRDKKSGSRKKKPRRSNT